MDTTNEKTFADMAPFEIPFLSLKKQEKKGGGQDTVTEKLA
jgi:hypothetical protein